MKVVRRKVATRSASAPSLRPRAKDAHVSELGRKLLTLPRLNAWGAFLTAHKALENILNRELESACGLPLTWFDALAQLRTHQPPAVVRSVAVIGGCATDDRKTPAGQTHHHLAVDAARVHWGYFSRALVPQTEVGSGDTITIETLTQHASDDPEQQQAEVTHRVAP